MKIDLDKIPACFNKRLLPSHNEGKIAYLVTPRLKGVVWTPETLIYRSSIWDEEGNLLSAGMPKFFNWGEQPSVSPPPLTLDNCNIVEKLDGSLLVLSKIRDGIVTCRTRGSDSIEHTANGREVTEFMSLNYQFLNALPVGSSAIFEWISPKNRIIIDYGTEPQFYLLNLIYHSDYKLSSQRFELDEIAKTWNLKRPIIYPHTDVSFLLNKIKDLENEEGVIVYSNNDQTLHKVKSLWYLTRHAARANMGSLKKVFNLWFELGRPDEHEFFKKVEEHVDYESAIEGQENIERINHAARQTFNTFRDLKMVAEEVKTKGATRKDRFFYIKDNLPQFTGLDLDALLQYVNDREPDEKLIRKYMQMLFKKQGEEDIE
jgi:hypothetical protein